MTTLQRSGVAPFSGPRRPPAPTELLDPARYTAREFHQLEVEKMWSRTWQLAGLRSELPNVGDFTEYEVGPYSVLLIRKDETSIVGYQNVCPHRGRRIKNGGGNSQELMCGFHGWTWNLDGEIVRLPERDTFAEFPDSDCSLAEVRVECLDDWVFVCFDPDVEALVEFLGPITPLLKPYRYDRQYRWFNRSSVIRGNWKTALDAFQEGYHARITHPESVEFVDYADHNVEVLGDHAQMTMVFGRPDAVAVDKIPDWDEMLDAMEWSFNAFGEDTSLVSVLRTMSAPESGTLAEMMIPMVEEGMRANNIDISALTREQLVDDWQFFIFPNIIINSHAFGYWLFRMRPFESDPDRSWLDMWYFHRVPDDMALPPDEPHQVIPPGESCGVVVDQDIRNIENCQLGYHHPAFRGLRLSSLETRISKFNDTLNRYIQAD